MPLASRSRTEHRVPLTSSPWLAAALLRRSALGFPRLDGPRHEYGVVRLRRSIRLRPFSACVSWRTRPASEGPVGGQCLEVVPTATREVPGREILPLEPV